MDNRYGISTFSEQDPTNPRNWSSKRRWLISGAVILLVFNATIASSGPSAVLHSMAVELDISQEVAALSITLFLLAYAAGPLFWAPMSEFYGRRWIFSFAFCGYIIFNFLCAFAPNATALFLGRFISGFFASSTISNAPGVLVDLWNPTDRANAMTVFGMVVFCGPALGPVISGFLELEKTWRWLFYVLLAMSAGTLPFLALIPETLPSALLHQKSKRIRQEHGDDAGVNTGNESDRRTLGHLFRTALVRPWEILIDPILLCCTAYTSLTYGLLYILFGLYPIVFQQQRGWQPGVSELPLLGLAVGAILGAAAVFWRTKVYKRKVLKEDVPVPEDRLLLAMIGGILFPIAMFWFAWTANPDVHWIVPTLAGVPLSASFLLISVALLNYLADTYKEYTASALAASAVCRTLSGAAAPLYTTPLFDRLGVAGGGSLIAGLACLLGFVPFGFYFYGPQIRARSRFARDMCRES